MNYSWELEFQSSQQVVVMCRLFCSALGTYQPHRYWVDVLNLEAERTPLVSSVGNKIME